MRNETLLNAEYQYKKDPFSRVFLRYAEELRKADQLVDALRICKEGLTHHPQYVPAIICKARILLEMNETEDAELDFQKALEMVPDHFLALKSLALLKCQSRQFEQAMTYIQKARFIDPNDQDLLVCIQEIEDQVFQGKSEEEQVAHEELDVLDEGIDDFVDEIDFEEDEPAALEAGATAEAVVNDPVIEAEQPAHERDELDEIDREFQRALSQNNSSQDGFWDDFDASDDVRQKLGGSESWIEKGVGLPETPLMTKAEQEQMLTSGLKHEKQEHYERARTIYRTVWEHDPGNLLAKEHFLRIKNVINLENLKSRKIRFMNNWLEKIKEVYHVQ